MSVNLEFRHYRHLLRTLNDYPDSGVEFKVDNEGVTYKVMNKPKGGPETVKLTIPVGNGAQYTSWLTREELIKGFPAPRDVIVPDSAREAAISRMFNAPLPGPPTHLTITSQATWPASAMGPPAPPTSAHTVQLQSILGLSTLTSLSCDETVHSALTPTEILPSIGELPRNTPLPVPYKPGSILHAPKKVRQPLPLEAQLTEDSSWMSPERIRQAARGIGIMLDANGRACNVPHLQMEGEESASQHPTMRDGSFSEFGVSDTASTVVKIEDHANSEVHLVKVNHPQGPRIVLKRGCLVGMDENVDLQGLHPLYFRYCTCDTSEEDIAQVYKEHVYPCLEGAQMV